MKTVLIIGGNIYKDSDANGICTRNIIRELSSRGYRVYCLSEPASKTDTYRAPDTVTIIPVKEPWYSRFLENNRSAVLFKTVSLFRYVATVFTYPDVSPRRTKRIIQACEALLKTEKIDLILGVYRPYESIAALLSLKRKYKEKIRCVAYHLDLLLSPNNTSRLIQRYKIAAGQRAYRKELHMLDKILLPEGANGGERDAKVSYVGFPLYTKAEGVPCETGFHKDRINITYIGSLDEVNRNPEFFLQAVDGMSDLKDRVRVHFWGKMTDAVLEIIRRYPQLATYHGIVKNAHVPYIYEKSDFLLNISNRNTPDMIPSKIYQMFASERPIINCVSDPKDRAAGIIEKYPAAFTLYEYRDNDPAAFADFLTRPHDMSGVSEDAFATSTPGYIVDVILEPFGADA